MRLPQRIRSKLWGWFEEPPRVRGICPPELLKLRGARANCGSARSGRSGRTYRGAEGFKQNSRFYIEAFPDHTIEITNVVATEDQVVVEFIGRGTHTGPLHLPTRIIPPTGRKGALQCTNVYQIENGKIVRLRSYYDAMSLLQQLGLVPAIVSTEDNIAIVHRYLDEVVNTGNLDAARDLFATDHVAHYAGFPAVHGHEDWKQLTSMSYTGFPDTYTTFEDEMAVGDKVVVRYTVRATHKGDFMNIPATGKPVKYTGIAIFRIANGKIAEQWQEADVVGLMQQLGESPAQPLTEPLGQQQTEGLQPRVNVTSPVEEVR